MAIIYQFPKQAERTISSYEKIIRDLLSPYFYDEAIDEILSNMTELLSYTQWNVQLKDLRCDDECVSKIRAFSSEIENKLRLQNESTIIERLKIEVAKQLENKSLIKPQ